MQPLTRSDVRPPAEYEPVRTESRRRVIELKRHRRVALGDLVTLVFENRDTVRGVVEELLRAERIEDEERIAEEVETFNGLIPAENELSATLFLEITDPAELARQLVLLVGIEGAVHLDVGGSRTEGVYEPGRSRADRASTVHYLRFRLDDAQRAAFLSGAEVVVSAEHPNYRARAVFSEDQRLALAPDLLAS
jgi:hypothetical protein